MNAAQKKALKGLGARSVCIKLTEKEKKKNDALRAKIERFGREVEKLHERSRKHPVRLKAPQTNEEYWGEIKINIRLLMEEILEKEKEIIKLLRALEKPMPKRKGDKK